MATPAATKALAVTELVTTVLEFLPTIDLLKASAVCRKWNDIGTSGHSIVIKHKLFAEPLSHNCWSANNWSEVAGIAPDTAFFDDCPHSSDDVKYSGVAVVLNPVLQGLNFQFDHYGIEVVFNKTLLFQTIGPNDKWGETYLSQPPAELFIHLEFLPRDAIARVGYVPLASDMNIVNAGMTINSLRQTLKQLRKDFAGDWTYDDIRVDMFYPI